MNTAQKIIKYGAIAFAFFLIFSILSGIMIGVMLFSNIRQQEEPNELKQTQIENIPQKLKINLISTKLEIRKSDSFSIETNHKIKIEENENQLIIKETKNTFSNKNYYLVINIPKDIIFDEISIDSGARSIKIDSISAQKLDLDLGAGKLTAQNLTVLKQTKIEGGAGEIAIQNSSLSNLDLDLGVGNLDMTSEIIGSSKINAGVGKIKLSLLGSSTDYKIHLEKGIGSVQIENNTIKEDSYYGTGDNQIDIEGGIGDINVYYEKK
mgnify:FL=1